MTKFLLAFFLFLPAFAQTPTPQVPSPIVSAQELPPPPVVFTPSAEVNPWTPPEWFKAVLTKANSIPYVGPFAVELMKWLGVIASILTALVTCFFAITKSLSTVMRLGKFVEIAAKIDGLYAKLSPYLKFFSMYNVQKEELKKA